MKQITNNIAKTRFFPDLSHCQLVQVPDAIYYMMRETPLVALNVANNVITKIPPKLPNKFSFIRSESLMGSNLGLGKLRL